MNIYLECFLCKGSTDSREHTQLLTLPLGGLRRCVRPERIRRGAQEFFHAFVGNSCLLVLVVSIYNLYRRPVSSIQKLASLIIRILQEGQ